MDKYESFKIGDEIKILPHIKIGVRDTDKFVKYKSGQTRMDLLSSNYYDDNPDYGWLIMLANPEVSSLEFLIPNDYLLRIPYPLETALVSYKNEVAKYIKNYGL